MSDVETFEPRAGFWRRFIATLVDSIIVSLIAAIVVGIPVVLLYAASNGAIQFVGLSLTQCVTVDLAQLPEGLDPPPPVRATSAVDCRIFLFGLQETARVLTVARTTKQGNVTETIGKRYMLGADGKPRKGISLDWVSPILFLIYLITLETRFGATLGMRPCHIRVVDIEAPSRAGIPLRKAVLRILLIWAGVVPVLTVLFAALIADHGSGEAIFNSGWLFTALFAAGLLTIAYYLWILVDVVTKKDPIYDRIARTAVLRSLG